MLLETALDEHDAGFEAALESALENSLARDAVIAKNASEREALWRLRHSISEAQKHEGASLKHDVSVPVVAMDRFIEVATAAVMAACPSARVIAFGHVGDGNVHFNVSQPPGEPPERFLAQRERIAAVVYDVVDRFDGSFSAEHGVGVLKKKALRDYRGGVELDLMRRLKNTLDPDGIMNPGKVL
ncbi:MAG: FAD-linked oxidase C-terminal domain-containing protein [Woeseiaceae bacterium]|nr:FAD-linked oxidase C-terminal domain-containing protein [Woeseiaceae bacterium]